MISIRALFLTFLLILFATLYGAPQTPKTLKNKKLHTFAYSNLLENIDRRALH